MKPGTCFIISVVENGFIVTRNGALRIGAPRTEELFVYTKIEDLTLQLPRLLEWAEKNPLEQVEFISSTCS